MVARRGHASLFLIKFCRAVNKIYRAMKSKYRGINEKYCAINGKLVRSHVIGCPHVVSVDEMTMAATVEEVCSEVNGSFYFREKIIEQYFAILLRHIAL